MKCKWISEDALDAAVSSLTNSSTAAMLKARNNRMKNVMDPFQSLIMASTFNISVEEQFDSMQDVNAALRGISNALGKFHQNVLSSVDGWVDHDRGFDLLCSEQKILAEVKNKHNTMNASNRRAVESELQSAVRQRPPGWRAFLVIIIPKKPERYTREISKGVFETDGASFYELATGERDAIHQLFHELSERLGVTNTIKSHCYKLMLQSLPK